MCYTVKSLDDVPNLILATRRLSGPPRNGS
jgi:hypothetical protein